MNQEVSCKTQLTFRRRIYEYEEDAQSCTVSAMTLTMAATAFAEEAGGLSGANCDPANTAKTDETITIAFGSEPSTLAGPATRM